MPNNKITLGVKFSSHQGQFKLRFWRLGEDFKPKGLPRFWHWIWFQLVNYVCAHDSLWGENHFFFVDSFAYNVNLMGLPSFFMQITAFRIFRHLHFHKENVQVRQSDGRSNLQQARKCEQNFLEAKTYNISFRFFSVARLWEIALFFGVSELLTNPASADKNGHSVYAPKWEHIFGKHVLLIEH